MEVINIILGSLLMLSALFLVVAVLFQDKTKRGLGSAIGGGSADTYFGKNKGGAKNAKLSKLTTIVSIVFAVLVLVTYLFC